MNIAALTQQQAAALLSVAPRTLRDWLDAPRNPDGTYNGPAIVAYYVAKMGGSDFDNQRERLAAAQAEKVEMENSVRRGQLADLAEVERFWVDCITNAKVRLLGMGSKLGPQLVNIGDASIIATAIRTEARAALAELADYDPASVPDVPAPTGPDSEPVGGHGKAVKQRKQRGAGAVSDG